jgi:hypothetical protein
MKSKTVATTDIILDKNTQALIKGIVQAASDKVKILQDQMQERISLINTGYVNASGGKGNYSLNEDFTKLVKDK